MHESFFYTRVLTTSLFAVLGLLLNLLVAKSGNGVWS